MIAWLFFLVWIFGSAGLGALTSWLICVATGRQGYWSLLPIFGIAWAAAGFVLLLLIPALIGWQVK